MANGNIRGITIELNGDTTGLEQALSNVNRESKDLQKELKEVERALKFDPGNAELVRQRQELLTQSIQQTSQKLDTLRQAQSQVQAQFDRGEIGADQYRAFQRELASTESQLSRFQSQLSGIQGEQDRLAQNTRQLGTFFAATGTDVDQFAGTLGTRLTQAIRDGSASADQMERALRLMGRQALGAGVDIDQMRAALRSVDNGSSLNDVRAELADITQEANQAGDSVNGFGDKLKGVAAGLAAGGGIALAFQQALDVSTLDTQIDISMNLNQEDATNVRNSIMETTAILGDEEAAYEGIRRQMTLNKGASFEMNKEIIAGATAISYAYKEIDFKELIQETHEIGKELGISQIEAMGMVNALLEIGFPPEQLDIISEYGSQLIRAGYSAQEVQGIIASGVETGTWNIDNLLDGLKEGRIVAAEFGQGVDKAMKDVIKGTNISAEQLQKWGQAVASGGQEGAKAMQEMTLALTLIDDETKRNEIGVKLFGTLWEEQGKKISDTILNAKKNVGDLAKNQQELNEDVAKMNADPAVSMAKAMAALKEAIAPVLVVMAEMVADIANWAVDNKELALTIAAIGTAVTAAVGAFALLAPAVSAVIPLFTTGGIAAGALSATMAAITGPIGLAVAAVAGISIAVGALANDLSQSSIEVEGWKGKVSEATAESLGSFMELSENATVALNQMSWSGKAVTQDMATSISETFANMGNQVLAEMQSDHEEQLTQLQNFYAQSSVLSDEQEAEAIAKTQTYHQNRQQVITDGMARINEILTTAYNEQRETTLAEETEMDRIKQQMQEAAIVHMSESAEEQKVILESLKQEASEITALQAAEVVKNSVKQKDETVAEAQKQYEESLKFIMWQRDDLGAISEEQAQLMINEAQRTRDETVKTAEEMHQDIVSEAKAQADEHVKQVDWETGEVKSKWEVMKQDVSKKLKETGAAIKRDWTKAWEDTQESVKSIGKSVSDGFTGMVKTVGAKLSEANKAVSEGFSTIITYVSGIPSKFVKIGNDIVDGLIQGIGNKFKGVKKKIEELANAIPGWARDILDIHSPSRVMREIGEWTGIGLAEGIESTEQLNQQMMQSVTDGILAVKKSFKDQAVKIDQDLAKTIKNTNEKANEDIAKIQKTAASKKRALTSDEIAKIYKLRSQAAESILKLEEKAASDRSKLAVNEKKAIENEYKDLLGSIKSFISDKKSLDQLSLKDEVLVWEQSLSLFEGSNDQRIAAQKEYKNALQALNDEIVSINKTYSDQINTVNENLLKEEEQRNQKYNDAVSKREASLASFASTFSAFSVEVKASGIELLSNLKSQVDGFKQWQEEFAKLSSRNIDTNLLAELSDLGVKALPELMALNQLTDEQLTQYSALYQEKAQLARTQAEAELSGMKADTQAKIDELRKAANAELTKLQSDWAAKIKGVTEGTKTELSSLKQIGVNAGLGLLEGLSSTAPALYAKAQEIANNIARTIAAALEIHSPSRVTMGFGVNINEGLIKGMEQSSGRLQAAMNNVYGSLASSAEKSVAIGTAQYNTTSSTTTSTTEQNFHITISSPKPLDPYETARLSRNALKEMGLQL